MVPAAIIVTVGIAVLLVWNIVLTLKNRKNGRK